MAVGEFRRLFCVLALVWLLGISVGCVFGQNGGHSFLYTREYLLNLCDSANRGLDLQNIDLPFEMLPSCPSTHSDSSHSINRQGKKKKRGRKGGVRQKLKKLKGGRAFCDTVKRSLTSVDNGRVVGKYQLHARVQCSEACLLAFTETWLDDRVHNHELTVDGFGAALRLDRNKQDTRKEQGGGRCLSTNSGATRSLFAKHSARLTLSCCQSHSARSTFPGNSLSCFSHLCTFIHVLTLRGRLNTLQITFINWTLYLLMFQNSYLGTLTIVL